MARLCRTTCVRLSTALQSTEDGREFARVVLGRLSAMCGGKPVAPRVATPGVQQS
jgi:hypothetical protein